MISFENVTKEYRLDNENTISPVRELNLQIEHGEFVVIVGRSGTGKTTLLNLAAGLVRPTRGRVSIGSQDLTDMNDREISSLRGRDIGFIFQFPSLLSSLTVQENVVLPGDFTGGKRDRAVRERAGKLLNSLGLASKSRVYPAQLSAGEQKRVVVARALINNPKLILADEPTSDLDVRTEKEVMDVFRSLNREGVTFLIVTHNLDLINFATRAFEMETGHLKRVN